MQICTVVARNYLAPARVLADSFLAHNPGGRVFTLIVDDLDEEVGAGEPFAVVRPAQLGIERWEQMVAGYDVLELSTAVKPWLVRHLLAAGDGAPVTYLDPDIQVFDSLQEVDDLLGSHALVVNPHVTAPLPRDGRRPTESELLASGSFNLGFAGFAGGAQTDALLDWWSERLATDCLVDPERGLFVDQRWMDFAPGLVPDLHVLRDPGYNVAYWNLQDRRLQRAAGGGVTVNDRPLRFLHLSGYDPAHPELLSRHQDRIDLAAHPVLRELCDGYGRALAQAEHERWRGRSYGYGSLPDGTAITGAMRRAYRDGVAAGTLRGDDIFTARGGERFLEHLRGPAELGGERGVSRFLAALWSSRRDLRESFPDLAGADGARMAAWAHVADDVPASLRGAHSPGAPGVVVAGYFAGVMGVGEHARQLASALETQEIPVRTVTLRPDAAPEDASLAPAAHTQTAAGDARFNLLCANAEMVPPVAETLGADFFADRHTIGFWAWEVDAFPSRYAGAFAYVDEVWVGSRHVRDAVAALATVPVFVIPQPVSLPERAGAATPPAGLPGGFRFLFAFDYLSVFERKNPLAVVDAFARAFEPGAGASLILKTLNDDRDPDAHRRLEQAVAGHPDIHLITERLSAAERDGLTAAADCYVSLHRAEGFGYTIAESMWAGKPVIATGYSGNTDYMTPDNSYPVDYRLVPIGPGHDPYPASGSWAQPDVAHAARLMREVFDDRAEAVRRGTRAAADIRASHGPHASGRVMAARLATLLTQPAWRSPRRSRARPGPLATDWVQGLIDSGPVPPPGGDRLAGAQAAARRGLLRLLKPVTVHERLVDGELLRAIEQLHAGLRSLADSHAAALGELEQLRGEVVRLRADRDAAERAQVDARSGSS